MRELKLSQPFSLSPSKHLFSNCPQSGPWSTLQINRTDKSLQLDMNSSVIKTGQREQTVQNKLRGQDVTSKCWKQET